MPKPSHSFGWCRQEHTGMGDRLGFILRNARMPVRDMCQVASCQLQWIGEEQVIA